MTVNELREWIRNADDAAYRRHIVEFTEVDTDQKRNDWHIYGQIYVGFRFY